MSDDPLAKNAAAQALGLIKPVSNDQTHYEALGRFLAAFANAEGASHVLVRKLSGLTDEKARLLFSGMRLADIAERIRGLVQTERVAEKSNFSEANLADIENCLDQIGHISRTRHNLVHRGASYFSGAFISANSMIAKTITSIETEIVEEHTLNQMQADCGAIFLRFVYIAADNPQDAVWLNVLRQRPWSYKPMAPNSRNQKRQKDSKVQKRKPRLSRASRRREAMQKHRSESGHR
jgi:hypothetical protein